MSIGIHGWGAGTSPYVRSKYGNSQDVILKTSGNIYNIKNIKCNIYNIKNIEYYIYNIELNWNIFNKENIL